MRGGGYSQLVPSGQRQRHQSAESRHNCQLPLVNFRNVSFLINIEQTMPIHLLIMYICAVTNIKHLIMKELDQKAMAENERQELQDRYIRFDWAIKVRHEVLLLIV